VGAHLTAGAIAELAAFVRIPSVSSQPAHAADVVTAAGWLAERLRRAGLEADLIRTPGHPVVLGSWRGAPGRPTVLLYGHYDVQPPGPATAWQSPPFVPQIRGNRLYGRGASDDKGQVLCQVAALDRLLRTGGRLPVNVICLYEGEEEIGSPSLPAVLDRHREELAVDAVLVCDTRMRAVDRPALVYGLRGAAALEVVVTGPPRDLHSGEHGGAVHNPATALCEIVASLHDADGVVRVPGFYAGVGNPARVAGGGAGPDWGVPGRTAYERTTAWPAISVHGLAAGHTGPGASSVIPASALARIGLRVVPGQDPRVVAGRVADHLAGVTPATVRTSVRVTSAADPVLVRRDGPAVRAAAYACTEVFGVPPVLVRSGGTIPAVAMLQGALGVDPVLLGFGLTADRMHAPDESFHLPTYARGIATLAAYLRRLGARRRLPSLAEARRG